MKKKNNKLNLVNVSGLLGITLSAISGLFIFLYLPIDGWIPPLFYIDSQTESTLLFISFITLFVGIGLWYYAAKKQQFSK